MLSETTVRLPGFGERSGAFMLAAGALVLANRAGTTLGVGGFTAALLVVVVVVAAMVAVGAAVDAETVTGLSVGWSVVTVPVVSAGVSAGVGADSNGVDAVDCVSTADADKAPLLAAGDIGQIDKDPATQAGAEVTAAAVAAVVAVAAAGLLLTGTMVSGCCDPAVAAAAAACTFWRAAAIIDMPSAAVACLATSARGAGFGSGKTRDTSGGALDKGCWGDGGCARVCEGLRRKLLAGDLDLEWLRFRGGIVGAAGGNTRL